MHITTAVIAPNCTVFVSEFSNYGSLLDINNRIRTATTKVLFFLLKFRFFKLQTVSPNIFSCILNVFHLNSGHARISCDAFFKSNFEHRSTFTPM